jgi:carbamoyltransferase
MTQWIAAVTRGHNAGVCLLKDGEIVFAVEEERLTRRKYDGAPFASIKKILDYTDKLDYLILAHTQEIKDSSFSVEYTGEDPYTSVARKYGLIAELGYEVIDHPQVIDYGNIHHKLHAACSFYRSGFDEAVSLVVDGAGTFIPFSMGADNRMAYETETIFGCKYPAAFDTLYRHLGSNGPMVTQIYSQFKNEKFNPSAARYEHQKVYPDEGGFSYMIVDGTPGIVKCYEAVTKYCGFKTIDAGKTMGLAPYGKEHEEIPEFFDKKYDVYGYSPVDINFVIPNYPNGATINEPMVPVLRTPFNEGQEIELEDLPRLQNRKDLAYKVQKQTQQEVLNLIRTAVDLSGHNNVVISGGYGLNCVANYWYLDQLKDEGINLYVEPVSNDAGTAIGAALLAYHTITADETVRPYAESLYLGPKYEHTIDEIIDTADKYGAEVTEGSDQDVIDLITNKNIVAMFQGRSESGPRALGNRSILYDPRDPDGKDFVNKVKRREFFRPFAGSMLKEHAHEWFDLRGMEESPHMMYAVNCQPGVEEKIPAIIHVDGTCRIQTVTEEQNENYYRLIKAFYDATGCPILFNTSFNLGGEPLVETLDDAVRTLANSGIEYLYLPEYGKLITLKN